MVICNWFCNWNLHIRYFSQKIIIFKCIFEKWKTCNPSNILPFYLKISFLQLQLIQQKYLFWHERVPFCVVRVPSVDVPLTYSGVPLTSGCVPFCVRMAMKRHQAERERRVDAKGTRSCQERYFYCSCELWKKWNLLLRPWKDNR